MRHYKRVSLLGLGFGILGVLYPTIWPSYSALLTILALGVTGLGLGCLLPVTTVSVQNAVPLHQLGTATGAMNFVRQLGSAVIVAVMGAIILGGFGGSTLSLETLTLTAELGYDYGPLFRWVFGAATAFLLIGYGFLLLMEQKPLRGPVAAHPVDPAAPAVATPNPPVKQ
jgi:MFS family permease